jgi:hypothetical protein
MKVKIEIEGAPPEVNAALAGEGEYGCYEPQHIRKILQAALEARATQILGDLVDMADPVVTDMVRLTRELEAIAKYERELWDRDLNLHLVAEKHTIRGEERL